MARIDNEPVDLDHPDQRVTVDHGRERPFRSHLIHVQEVADLLGFCLHRARTETEVFRDLARRDIGLLR